MCQKDDAIKVYDVMLHVSVTLTRSVVSIRTPERGRGVSQGDVITVHHVMLQVAVTPTGAVGAPGSADIAVTEKCVTR